MLPAIFPASRDYTRFDCLLNLPPEKLLASGNGIVLQFVLYPGSRFFLDIEYHKKKTRAIILNSPSAEILSAVGHYAIWRLLLKIL
jgi:hypothetical protein